MSTEEKIHRFQVEFYRKVTQLSVAL